MNAYWFNVITTLWLVAALPRTSATKVCYNSFGTLVCRDRMSVHARIGIWVAFLLLLVLIIAGIIYWQRRRASRQRDAIATVEANQLDGPSPTPFESGFDQVKGPPVSCPAPAYYSHGHRTAAVPQSAHAVGFTLPRTANNPSASKEIPPTQQRANTPHLKTTDLARLSHRRRLLEGFVAPVYP